MKVRHIKAVMLGLTGLMAVTTLRQPILKPVKPKQHYALAVMVQMETVLM